jgi:hypothetical protein
MAWENHAFGWEILLSMSGINPSLYGLDTRVVKQGDDEREENELSKRWLFKLLFL